MTITKSDFESKARPLAQQLMAYIKQEGGQYGITDALVAIGSASEQENSVEGGEVVSSVSGDSWGVTVILYAGKKTLKFAQNSLDFDLLREAIDKNMQVIHLVPDNEDKRLLESDKVYKGPVQDLDLCDGNPPTQDELIAYAQKMEAAAFAVSGVKTSRESSIKQNGTHSLTIATNGLDHLTSRTAYQAVTSAIAANNHEMQVDYDYSIARHFNDMAAPEEVGQRAGQSAVAKLGAELPDSKEASIILSPDAAATFFSSVMAAIDGTALHKGATFLKDKQGQQVMSPGITIEDDPLIEKAMGSQVVDSVGMKAEKVTFIENGVLKQYNVDLEEARKLGIEPIGRNDGPTNLRVLPGQQSKEDLMADIKDGFYIQGFNGGTANVNNGSFSRQAYGMRIENGRITNQAVAGFVVAGNLKNMFMNVSVANDTPDLPHPKYTNAVPTTRIDGIKIAGR